MEYGTRLSSRKPTDSDITNVGWHTSTTNNSEYDYLFSKEHIIKCQQKITQLLEGVTDRPIIVPIDTISSVMVSCFKSRRPKVGDIYSQFIQPNEHRNDIRDIVDRTINIIVSQVTTEFKTNECNRKLSIWNTVYGDFNQHGIRSHPTVKIREKRINNEFHMRY